VADEILTHRESAEESWQWVSLNKTFHQGLKPAYALGSFCRTIEQAAEKRQFCG
jgi:hypothetical protein